MITVTAFAWVPPPIQGWVRDYRVRWALEEAGLPYQVKPVALGAEQASADYLALQPFGQVPALIDPEHAIELFESGAIVLHVAERSPALMPEKAADRARVIAWIFAALNSLEPFVLAYGMTKADAWQQIATKRLRSLAEVLRDREFLVGDRFTAADLMVASVLRINSGAEIVEREPTVAAFVARCTARPAFQKAIADQLATFAAHAPA